MKNGSNWIYHGSGQQKRIAACFTGNAYAAHRHVDYTFAVTLHGVQSFNYRGAKQHSLPGQVVILHPDELHDGQAGTEAPFQYRAIAINPAEIQEALNVSALPFIKHGTSTDPTLTMLITSLVADLTRALTIAEYQDSLYELANTLQRLAGKKIFTTTPNLTAVKKAREFIDASLLTDVTLDELSKAAEYSKWQLSRDFRQVYGSSPYHYLVLKRLEKADIMIRQGVSLATVAASCHFADQSHFSRHFKNAFGISPKKWSMLIQSSHDRSIF